MKKALLIYFQDFHTVNDGGSLVNKRNAEMVTQILGKENVDFYFVNNTKKRSLLSLAFAAFLFPFGYFNGLTPSKLKSIIKMSNKYDYILINTSLFGIIAKKLKENGYKGKVISFFHNIERYYYEARVSKMLPFRNIVINCAAKNDEYSIKHASISIGLCERDCNILQKEYGKEFDAIVPVTFNDKCEVKNYDLQILTNKRPKCYFIGSNFPANSEGLLWFVKNVLPHVDIDFKVIGKDMDLLKNSETCLKDITVLSNVPDLSQYFEEADFMIFPIFSGSGMKVKTCEALMYGKNILGSKESFEGYELDTSSCGKLCNTAKEYIDTIKYFSENPVPRYNVYSRSIFETKYSNAFALKVFRELFR